MSKRLETFGRSSPRLTASSQLSFHSPGTSGSLLTGHRSPGPPLRADGLVAVFGELALHLLINIRALLSFCQVSPCRLLALVVSVALDLPPLLKSRTRSALKSPCQSIWRFLT